MKKESIRQYEEYQDYVIEELKKMIAENLEMIERNRILINKLKGNSNR